jgi:GTPase
MWLSMNESENEQSSSNSTRALVIGPYLPRRSGRDDNMRAPSERLEEAAGLAAAIDLELVDAQSIALSQIRPSTYLGKGKVEDIGAFVEDNHIGLIVMDCSLSPVQQRNLEKAWNAKVIDRTGLILEIFGSRARTREGTLQVELAHLASVAPGRRRLKPIGGCYRSGWRGSSVTSRMSSAPALCTGRTESVFLIP